MPRKSKRDNINFQGNINNPNNNNSSNNNLEKITLN